MKTTKQQAIEQLLTILDGLADFISLEHQREKRKHIQYARFPVNPFEKLDGKRVKLIRHKLVADDLTVDFEETLPNLLGILKEKGLITDFKPHKKNLSMPEWYYEVVLPVNFENLYKKRLEDTDNSHFQTIQKTIDQLPLVMGKDEAIFIRGKNAPTINKGATQYYYFLRGALEKVNDDGTIDRDVLYSYLLENGVVEKETDKMKRWEKLRKIHDNLRRDKFGEIKKYLQLDTGTKRYLKWTTN